MVFCVALAVYPRAYGEQGLRKYQTYLADGLSPCLRGTGFAVVFTGISERFIPVLTGNRWTRNVEVLSTSVYPRAYGEQQLCHGVENMIDGLSPCLRGTDYQR